MTIKSCDNIKEEKEPECIENNKDEFVYNEDEFNTLTKIGNSFRIRHHETDKIEIQDIRYYDYFFNRCLSLIAIAIQYLK